MVSSEQQLCWLGQPGGAAIFKKCPQQDITLISSQEITKINFSVFLSISLI
jgi:hypothetical protein